MQNNSLDNQLEIKFKLVQYCFLLHSGLHQAKLKNCPTFSFRISSKRETSLGSQILKFKRTAGFSTTLYTPGVGGIGASYNSLYPEVLSKRGFIKDREIHCSSK